MEASGWLVTDNSFGKWGTYVDMLTMLAVRMMGYCSTILLVGTSQLRAMSRKTRSGRLRMWKHIPAPIAYSSGVPEIMPSLGMFRALWIFKETASPINFIERNSEVPL